jgi:hypothetical protein
MGCVDNITAEKYPRQGAYLNSRVRVCFQYDTTEMFLGVVIRDDAESPGHMIIKLDNGRVLLATECQWQPVR